MKKVKHVHDVLSFDFLFLYRQHYFTVLVVNKIILLTGVELGMIDD